MAGVAQISSGCACHFHRRLGFAAITLEGDPLSVSYCFGIGIGLEMDR